MSSKLELPQPLTSVLSSAFMILYGVLVEKWYVSKYSIASNVWTLFITILSSGNLSLTVRTIFASYCVIGIIVIGWGKRILKWFFGSRFIGGCLLALAFLNERWPLIWLNFQPVSLEHSLPATDLQRLFAIFQWGFCLLSVGFLLRLMLPPIEGEDEDSED